MAYSILFEAFSENKSDEVKAFCDILKTELLAKPRHYELIELAARWAELELRSYNM